MFLLDYANPPNVLFEVSKVMPVFVLKVFKPHTTYYYGQKSFK